MPCRPTTFQKTLANAIGVNIRGDSERVAAARIRQYVAVAIHENSYDEPVTQRQIDYAKSLGISVGNDTKGIASAKIEDRLHDLNMKALRRLALNRGDRVKHKSRFIMSDGSIHEHVSAEVVSSISASGRVFFKGVGCKSGWPTNIVIESEQTEP